MDRCQSMNDIKLSDTFFNSHIHFPAIFVNQKLLDFDGLFYQS